jgi:hypothetical protein
MQSYNDFLQLVERKQEALDLIKLIKKIPTEYKMEVFDFDSESEQYVQKIQTVEIKNGTDLVRALKDDSINSAIGGGLSHEGGGYFSTVFSGANSRASMERQYVLKHSTPGRTGEKDRWQDFAALSQKNESNPLFPKVLYFREFDHGEMLAVIEYLDIDASYAEGLGVDKGKFRVVAELVDVLNDNPHNVYAKEQVYGYAKMLKIQPEHLIDFLTKIKTLNAELDIHAFNVGWRGKQMVIFDPVSWNADYGAEGL